MVLRGCLSDFLMGMVGWVFDGYGWFGIKRCIVDVNRYKLGVS